MTVTEDYFRLAKQYEGEYGERTIVLMQVGSFFEVYGLVDGRADDGSPILSGSQMQAFVQCCDLAIADKHCTLHGKPVMMAGFKDSQLDKYLRKLEDACFTVPVYVQEELVPKQITRRLVHIYSPGTSLATHSSTATHTPQSLSNNIVCLWLERLPANAHRAQDMLHVGAAALDICSGELWVLEYDEPFVQGPAPFDDLERFLSIYLPHEAICIHNLDHLDRALSFLGLADTRVLVHHIDVRDTQHPNHSKVVRCEKQVYQRASLARYYAHLEKADRVYDEWSVYPVATQAMVYLLDFVKVHSAGLVTQLHEPRLEQSRVRLFLANHSLKQLHMLPDGSVPGHVKHACVAHLLNQCCTPMGKRAFHHQLLHPVFDTAWLRRRYDDVDWCMKQVVGSREAAQRLLRLLQQVRDLAKAERDLWLRKTKPRDLALVYRSLFAAHQIAELSLFGSMDAEWQQREQRVRADCQAWLETLDHYLVRTSIESLDAVSDATDSFFQTGAFPLVDDCQRAMDTAAHNLGKLQQFLHTVIASKEKRVKSPPLPGPDHWLVQRLDTDKFITTERRANILLQQWHHFESTAMTLGFCNSPIQLVKKTASQCILHHPIIQETAQVLTDSRKALMQHMQAAYEEVLQRLEGLHDALDRILAYVVEVDVLYAKARVAHEYGYCRPQLIDGADHAYVHAVQLRHCLIERFQRDELYVANDLSLGMAPTQGMLLYGTNAVGKTSLIRALGIAVLLAQAGMFVPCSEMTLSPYRQLFTRISGNDNLFQGLSTFEVEMTELRTILRMADAYSLILGDELCSGTETMSAVSIFVSGLEALHRARSSFIFATHFHEIVNYEEVAPIAIRHMEVIYQPSTQSLVYQRVLKEGPGNSKYGLEVCKAMRLPASFIDRAYTLRAKYHPECSVLEHKPSRYNAQKLVGLCESCHQAPATETHHVYPQRLANAQGIIVTDHHVFHKDHVGNLRALCEACHLQQHHASLSPKRRKRRNPFEEYAMV